MNQLTSKKVLLLLFISILSLASNLLAQEFKIHKRGMLHETIFNTGDIGRPWVNNSGGSGDKTNVPLMEWPSNSRTIVNGITYDGQHNILGGGVYLGGNLEGQPGQDKRIWSFCGAVGSGTPEIVVNKWVFPLSITRTENYPLLSNGDLNPNYNPDEAEEIIVSKWGTTIGVTVTRTSRAWSYPDYDDMIIYEYEFDYTGDINGSPNSIEQTTTLKDFMVAFNYGFAPSMYGYQRHYQTWKYNGGLYQADNYNVWDSDYWLSYNLDSKTTTDQSLPGGKPEPDPILFKRFAQTGENGGGFASPQAPGYAMLYYPLDNLAVLDPVDLTKNESDFVKLLRKDSGGNYYELDSKGRVKQPFNNKITTGVTSSSKLINEWLNPYYGRWASAWTSTTAEQIPPYFYGGDRTKWIEKWAGRSKYNKNQSSQSCSKLNTFGPYTLKHGTKLRFALAEVVGYGQDHMKFVEGGLATYNWSLNTQFSQIPGMDRKVVLGGQVMTENYLKDFGYPDYVNSNVRTVQQVAHKAHQAYLGKEPLVPVWPEDNPNFGSYKIPVPCPAPIIKLSNTATADIKIEWKRTAESFTHPRLMGKLTQYKIYKSLSGMGPWKLVKTINVGNVNSSNQYEHLDIDNDFKIGESRFYCVTSIDDKGNESGKTNLIQFSKKVGAVEKMGKVYVVPNPFISKSGFAGDDGKIGFYGLPPKCTIRIFTYAGQLVETIEHEAADSYSIEWFQTSKNGQEIASGVYLYIVNAPTGEVAKGKFVVIK